MTIATLSGSIFSRLEISRALWAMTSRQNRLQVSVKTSCEGDIVPLSISLPSNCSTYTDRGSGKIGEYLLSMYRRVGRPDRTARSVSNLKYADSLTNSSRPTAPAPGSVKMPTIALQSRIMSSRRVTLVGFVPSSTSNWNPASSDRIDQKYKLAAADLYLWLRNVRIWGLAATMASPRQGRAISLYVSG